MEEAWRVRIASPRDAAALLHIYAPYVTETAITFEYDIPSLEEFTQRIARTLTRYPYLVLEEGTEILGYAYASAFHARAAYDWAVETSIYVAQDCRGRGAGRRLYDALESVLRYQGMLNLYACIAYPPAEDPHLSMDSVLFHQHLGYRMVGRFERCGYKFSRWYDMVWMEKEIGEHLEHQPPVRAFPEIRAQLFSLGIQDETGKGSKGEGYVNDAGGRSRIGDGGTGGKAESEGLPRQ